MKNINIISLAIIGAGVIGCSSTNQPQHLSAVTQIIQTEAPLYVTNDKAIANNFKLVTGNDRSVEAAFKQYARTGKAPNIKTDGFERFAYSPMQQPVISCEPFQETVITLEGGEKFTSITSGDPANLSYKVAASGAATGVETQQVLVKPGLAHMSTNLVIVTDKRVYNILIVVGTAKSKITRNVAFWYPEEMTEQINKKTTKQNNEDLNLNGEQMSSVDVAHANFDYKISGDEPSWTPVRVFDDGKRTYIQMPKGIDSKSLPVVLVQSDSGQDTKYNVSYYSPYMLVDGIFSQVKLVAGVGGNQVEVDIYNKNYKK